MRLFKRKKKVWTCEECGEFHKEMREKMPYTFYSSGPNHPCYRVSPDIETIAEDNLSRDEERALEYFRKKLDVKVIPHLPLAIHVQDKLLSEQISAVLPIKDSNNKVKYFKFVYVRWYHRLWQRIKKLFGFKEERIY